MSRMGFQKERKLSIRIHMLNSGKKNRGLDDSDNGDENCDGCALSNSLKPPALFLT